MSFKDIHFYTEYRPGKNNAITDFYIPVLKTAVIYKRSVGFFSSTILTSITPGLMDFLNKDGNVELVVSPKLTEEDIDAIYKGYEERDKVIENAIMREFYEPRTYFESERLNLLAHMIANNKLDIKVAFTVKNDRVGIYHEKMGLIYDEHNNIVVFTGSPNETGNALINNYEVFDVFCSWQSDFEKAKVLQKETAFHMLWTNADSKLTVIDFPKIARDKLETYKRDTIDIGIDLDELKQEERVDILQNSDGDVFFEVPRTIEEFYDYQQEAVNTWMANNCKGIFDMATGTGKTYTALYGLCKLSRNLYNHLAVVIVAPYKHLVEQWVEDIENFGVNPIIAYSESRQKKWKKYFNDSINAYNCGVINHFCIVTTNSTFSSDYFQKQISRIKKDACIVIDEAHNFGAYKLRHTLPDNFNYRLALSATIERYRDEDGTEVLRNYFGKTCQCFSLEEAIRRGFLSSYYYYPICVTLTAEELEQYSNITKIIARLGGGSEKNCEKNDHVKLLLLKRARVVAGAHNKVNKLIETIRPYANDSHMLVYCGATKYDREDIDDESDIKQINEVGKLLWSELNMKYRKFTVEENKQDRINIKNSFANGDLQVITAIKCLDEGVNIPSIKRAFILASSTNPKEYIQRRGRVLRKSPDKEYSEIFDFITLPRPLEQVCFCSSQERKSDLTLIRKELARMEEFAKNARVQTCVDELREIIFRTYGLYNLSLEDAYND